MIDFCQDCNEKVVVVTAWIHLRHFAFFCLKQPFQRIASAMDIGKIVLRSCHILGFLHLISILCRILVDVVCRLIGTHERREFVISHAVSVVREDDALLNHGCNIFFNQSFAV